MILNDFSFIVGIERSSDVNKFLFVASPKNKGENEGSSWDGKIGAIKKAIESNLKEQKSLVSKKIALVQNEMASSKTKVGLLEEKVDGLQGMGQK